MLRPLYAPGPWKRAQRLGGEAAGRGGLEKGQEELRRKSLDGGQMQVHLLGVHLGKARCSSPVSRAEILLAACKTDMCSVKGGWLSCCRGSGWLLQPHAELCQVNAHPLGQHCLLGAGAALGACPTAVLRAPPGSRAPPGMLAVQQVSTCPLVYNGEFVQFLVMVQCIISGGKKKKFQIQCFICAWFNKKNP